MPAEWTGCRQNALVFQTGHHVWPPAVAVFGFALRIEGSKTGREDDRARLDLLDLGLHIVVDSGGETRLLAHLALTAGHAVEALGGFGPGLLFGDALLDFGKAALPLSHGDRGLMGPGFFSMSRGIGAKFSWGSCELSASRRHILALQIAGYGYGGLRPAATAPMATHGPDCASPPANTPSRLV